MRYRYDDDISESIVTQGRILSRAFCGGLRALAEG
jgi:hypothetical protein